VKKLNLVLLVIALIGSSLFAQRTSDIAGSKDYPSISRFKGSVIEFYKETKWGSYKLPVNNKGKIDWEKPKALEGKVTRIQYLLPKENNAEFVLHNYKAGFKNSGYKILIAIANEELGFTDRPHTWNDKYYVGGGYYDGLNNIKFGEGVEFPSWRKNHSFIAAQGHENGKDIYAMVYTVVGEEYTLIIQDVVEVEAVETGLVSVDNISKDITKSGHIAIYGIRFETGKSVLKKESAKALKTISEYINKHKDKKFFIVGHTDNVGNFDSNMKLSKNRALSVIKELSSKYSVDANQLEAHGVSSLSPVASNLLDEGRAKNRRVEIVER